MKRSHLTPSRNRFAARTLPTRLAAVALSATLAPACLDRPVAPLEPSTTSTILEHLRQQRVDKIDLLLAIDNSSSMSDKQEILAAAIPDLVGALMNPRCIDATGAPAAVQPKGPGETCPIGTVREFDVIDDIHIGIISSSLGGRGADYCTNDYPTYNKTMSDMGRLVARKAGGAAAETYEDLGFLAWDPNAKLDPPGESDSGALLGALGDMVVGVGQTGCGFEAQLESWYRFLVDPEPYASIKVGSDGKAHPQGIDHVLLAQRQSFLRPDSLVAIVMLTDENDCSIADDGTSYVAGKLLDDNGNAFHLPRATSACEQNPESRCCRPCDAPDPAGCTESAADPACQIPHDLSSDHPNLRCFDQKRRFGFQALWPVQRYIDGLTRTKVKDRSGVDRVNPLYAGKGGGPGVRDSSLVFFAGIVGVPWQDIAVDSLDLSRGYLTAAELEATGRWDVILGDPAKGIAPTDPLMIESSEPRSGMSPITGDSTAPPGSAPMANLINGHEYETKGADLQYACLFPLSTPRECAGKEDEGCDCAVPGEKPVCQDPQTGSYSTVQRYAKAYPGVRQLEVLRGIGDQGVVASICPAQMNDPKEHDYGYRPAVSTLIDRVRRTLQVQCLPRELEATPDGEAACVVIEAQPRRASGCACVGAARREVPEEHEGALRYVFDPQGGKVPEDACVCEIVQVDDAGREACQNSTNPAPYDSSNKPVDGWCYVDAALGFGNPDLVASCPENEKRMVRFVGEGRAVGDARVFITCHQRTIGE